jgi:mono/diheme cytochrome c family protein
MKTGGMKAVAGTPEQMGSLVAYLRTLSAPQPGTQAIAQTSGNSATPLPETVAAPNTSAAPTAPPTAPSGAATATVETTPTAGRALFVAQGCAACHGSTAQGTRFAPSLIDITTRFPGDKLSTLLHHPTSKMRDGGMPAVTVNDSQMQQLVAYMSGLKPTSADLPNPHGGPSVRTAAAQPVEGEAAVKSTAPAHAAAPIPLSALALRGQQVYLRNSCETCHGVGGVQGTVAAPGLAGTASILPASTLENLLRHHSIQMQKGGMPLTNMNARDMQALVAYVRSMPAVEQ